MTTAQNKSNKGFTLIELMIAIAIIAVLAVIGITVYSNVQQTARNSRRTADLESISRVIELTKTPSTAYYLNPPATGFSSGSVPQDPITNSVYCAAAIDTVTTPASTLPLNPVLAVSGSNPVWSSTTACPTGYTTVPAAGPVLPAGLANYTAWKVCVRPEGGAAPICRTNQQS
jgi:prepilin-type N-terminal cleavage/methylation domain-containing protein